MNARQKFFEALKEYRYSEDFARTHQAHGHGVTGDVIKLFETFEAANKMPPPMQEEINLFQQGLKLPAARSYTARLGSVGPGSIAATCLLLAEGYAETEHDVPTLRMGEVR